MRLLIYNDQLIMLNFHDGARNNYKNIKSKKFSNILNYLFPMKINNYSKLNRLPIIDF